MISTEYRLSHLISEYADIPVNCRTTYVIATCFKEGAFHAFFQHLNWIYQSYQIFQSHLPENENTLHLQKMRDLIDQGVQKTSQTRKYPFSVAICAVGNNEPLQSLARNKKIKTITLFGIPQLAQTQVAKLNRYQQRKCRVVELDLTGGLFDHIAAVFSFCTEKTNVKTWLTHLYETFFSQLAFPKKFDFIISSLVGTQLVNLSKMICDSFYHGRFKEKLELDTTILNACQHRVERSYIDFLSTTLKAKPPSGFLYLADTWKVSPIGTDRATAHKAENPHQVTINEHFSIERMDEWSFFEMESDNIHLWTTAYLLRPNKFTHS